jgi:transposase
MTPTTPTLRWRSIDRHRFSTVSLDQQLPDDHPVPSLWEFTAHLDLAHFHRPTKAVEGHPDAPSIPTRLLFALWLFSLSEGCASAHALAEACVDHLPYQWLCGGQPVNYHTLADFYSANAAAIHTLFVEHVARLRAHGLIDLSRVTVAGRKVIANSDKARFHREPTWQRHRQEAEEHLVQVLAEAASPSRSAAQVAGPPPRRPRAAAALGPGRGPGPTASATAADDGPCLDAPDPGAGFGNRPGRRQDEEE